MAQHNQDTKKIMKTFLVYFYYEELGKATIKARNAKEAKEKVIKCLEDQGLDTLNYSCNGRNYDTTDCEEID